MKVVGISGAHTLSKNHEFPGGGVNAKNGNSRGFSVNLTGNPGRSTSKKSISSTGGIQYFSGKAQYKNVTTYHC